MHLALEQARQAASMGEVPIGAVVVYEPVDPATRCPLASPRVIAEACNRREIDRNPAGHAEFLALEQAARELDAWRLTGCTVYVTLEPCVMCAGLMHQARVDRCVYGASDPKAGALGTLYSIHADERLNHQFQVTSGVCEQECAELLKGFFAQRRAKAKQLKQEQALPPSASPRPEGRFTQTKSSVSSGSHDEPSAESCEAGCTHTQANQEDCEHADR